MQTIVFNFEKWLQRESLEFPYSKKTILKYTRIVEQWFFFLQAQGVQELVLKPDLIKETDLTTFLFFKKKRHCYEQDGVSTRQTVLGRLAALQLLWDFFQSTGWVENNLPAQVKHTWHTQQNSKGGRGGRQAVILPKVLNWNEQTQLLDTVDKNPRTFSRIRDKALITLFLVTGLRTAEMEALALRDCTFESGRLMVYGGKGAKDRVVRFDPAELEPALSAWLAVRLTLEPAPDAPLFLTKTGQPFKGIYQSVSHYIQAAGLAREGRAQGAHLLRHTAISRMFAKRLSVPEIMANAGHSNLKTIQIYTHLLVS